jgi:hypothetical protein
MSARGAGGPSGSAGAAGLVPPVRSWLGDRDAMTPAYGKYFFSASILTAALLVPHAGVEPVLAGMALAFLVRWLRSSRGA